MTDVQWHDLVGNFGVVGALLLALVAYVIYTRLKPKESNATTVDQFEVLRGKLDEVLAAITSVAEKNRHDARASLTAVQAEILNHLLDLAAEMRETLGRIERGR